MSATGQALALFMTFIGLEDALIKPCSTHLTLNLNGLPVTRQIDNTSPGGAPGGKSVPGFHKRCEQSSDISAKEIELLYEMGNAQTKNRRMTSETGPAHVQRSEKQSKSRQ